MVAVDAGNGRHLYYLSPSQTSNAIKWNTIAFIPGVMSFSVPKLGVAVLLMRLLNPSKIQQYIIYSLSCACVIISALCAVFLWRQCQPSAGLWNPALKPVCWKPSILVNFAIFAGCKLIPILIKENNDIPTHNQLSRLLRISIWLLIPASFSTS